MIERLGLLRSRILRTKEPEPVLEPEPEPEPVVIDAGNPVHPDFDGEAYLAANPDVAAAGWDAWDHFDRHGLAEGRRARPQDPSSPGYPVPPRERFLFHLSGTGIELGPGHHPYPLTLPGAEAQYVDRWAPDENAELFPELLEATFPKPDIQANLDTDRLSVVADQSQDFVIASHVLEHVANPLAILADMHRVLRPGGIALIFLPDKRRTFDEPREVTSLQHVVDEYESDVTEVDDEHIIEFLQSTEESVPAEGSTELADVIAWHRQRSIHVHCWTEHDFPAVIRYGIASDEQRWELVDLAAIGNSNEFGFLLRRATSMLDSATMASRFDAIYAQMFRSATS